MTPDETYDGPVAFVDGVHYPVGEDGHADESRPLRHVEGATYRGAEDGEALHNDAVGVAVVAVEIEAE
jgi:hypothetical protein